MSRLLVVYMEQGWEGGGWGHTSGSLLGGQTWGLSVELHLVDGAV